MSSESLEQCREKALRLLENSPHSVAGLKRKLFNAKKFSSQEISTILADLLKAGLLDDRQFAEDYVQYLKSTSIGRYKAAFKLKGKGVPQNIINDVMERLWNDNDDDTVRALDAARRKWDSLQSKDQPMVKKLQAVARFLVSRGFSMQTVRMVLDNLKKT